MAEEAPEAPKIALIELGKGLVHDIAAIISFYQTTGRATGQDVIKVLLAMTAHATAQNALQGHLDVLAEAMGKELVKAIKVSKFHNETPQGSKPS